MMSLDAQVAPIGLAAIESVVGHLRDQSPDGLQINSKRKQLKSGIIERPPRLEERPPQVSVGTATCDDSKRSS